MKEKIKKVQRFLMNYRLYLNFPKNLIRYLKLKKEPIILCGAPRSGTTLLMSILDSHPEIHVVPYETTILQKRKLKDRVFKNDYLHFKFIKLQMIGILFAEIIKKNSNRWCEKTPLNLLNVQEIDKMYKGKVKFIHIQRDGRAVVSSYHRNWGYMVTPRLWEKCTLEAEKYREKPNFLIIKYEDLVQNQEVTLKIITDFLKLNEPFAKNWFEKTRIKGNIKRVLQNQIEGSAVTATINTASLDKWKESESPNLKMFLENPKYLKLNKRLGYK